MFIGRRLDIALLRRRHNEGDDRVFDVRFPEKC
jgi:hypothetical protein